MPESVSHPIGLIRLIGPMDERNRTKKAHLGTRTSYQAPDSTDSGGALGNGNIIATLLKQRTILLLHILSSSEQNCFHDATAGLFIEPEPRLR